MIEYEGVVTCLFSYPDVGKHYVVCNRTCSQNDPELKDMSNDA